MKTVGDSHTIGRLLADRALASPDAIAINDRGVTITYAALNERVAALGDRLRAAGFGPGDRIATVSGNSIDHVVAFFGCARAGAAFTPLSWRLAQRELTEALESAQASLLLVEDEYLGSTLGAVRQLDHAPTVALLGSMGVELDVPRNNAREGELDEVRDDTPLLIMYTSGSEAAPKGVILTHENVFWTNLALQGAIQLTADDVVLAMLPQFHIAAWNCEPILALWVGATIVLERGFQPERILQLIAERGVTAMMGVPTQYRLIADDPQFAPEKIASLRVPIVGGAALPAGLAERWEAAGIPLTRGYGLTEAGPNTLWLAPDEAEKHPNASGRPYPHVTVRLSDPETGLELAGVATGELWVRGPNVFVGYLNDDEATARALVDGWLRTGDIASRDADGIYTIVDRRKEMYISGGENVAPAEVERALLLHPMIAEAAVVGVPDDVWGERGVAFVVRAPGAALGADEVFTHARSQLAGFKVPVHIEFVAELPRSAIDKVARPVLRERARELMKAGSHEHR